MTKARENSDYTGLAADIVAGDTAARAGRKNLIINGGMQISQRGDYSSATAITNGTFYLDRFRPYRNGAAATVQQTDVTINSVNKKAMKVAATTTSSGYIGFYQTMELQNIPVGETLTVSCWVRSNNSNTRFRANDFRGVSVDGNAFTNDGNWEKVTWTFGSSSTTQDPVLWVMTYDAGAVSVTSGDYIEVADFQLEVGSVATDFEHRSYGEELALCQRFYYNSGAIYLLPMTRYSANAGPAYTWWTHPVYMRVAPTITTSAGWGSGGGYSGAVVGTVPSISGCTLGSANATVANGTIYADGGQIMADAEL